MTSDAQICAYCGAPLSPNARFCEACGQPVSGSAPSPFEAKPASAESWSRPDAEEFPIPPMPETDRWGSVASSPADNDPQRWGSPQPITPSAPPAAPQSSYIPPAKTPTSGGSFPWKGIIIAAVVLVGLSCLCVIGAAVLFMTQTGTNF